MAVHLVTGDDDSLVMTAVSDLVRRLVGEGDRSLMVDDLDGDDLEVAAIVDAAQTPSFLTERRVVVARGVGRYSTGDVAALVAYLGDPLPTTDLVLVAGGVPPWDLTDAVDRGDTAGALALLHRMMGAGDRHPLQVMAILHAHVVRFLKLDGVDARDEAAAAAALGIKPGFPVRKALDQYRRLGSAGTARALALLAQADLDLRGAKEWSEELVMEVLVARLSRLAPPVRRR